MTDSLPEALAACTAQPLPYALLADRDDGTVVRCGEVVAKAHAGDADHEALAVRLRIAGHQALGGVLLPPLLPVPGRVQNRPVSLWPYGTPVDPRRPEEAPWEATAGLLAALHRTPLSALPGPLPPMRGPAKLARALDRLRLAEALPAGPDPGEVRSVRAAARTLPAWARGEAEAPPGGALCHGDLHLGQLVRYPAPQGPWFLIDVDDLGLGTPTWDLGRPAAWYAAGLLAPKPGSASSTPTGTPAARPPDRPAPIRGRNSTSRLAPSPCRRPRSPWPRRRRGAADSTRGSG